jgi:hypothetical protein
MTFDGVHITDEYSAKIAPVVREAFTEAGVLG